VHERFIFNGVLAAYEEAFDAYNDKLMDLEKAKAKLWSLEYGFKDSIDWEADYQGNIDFYTAEIARAQAALQNVPKNLDLEAWNAEVENLKDSIDAYNYGRQANTADSVYYMVNVYHEGVEKYERAFKAWLVDKNVSVSGGTLNVSNLVPKPKDHNGNTMTAPPVEPKAADYALNSDRAKLDIFNVVVTLQEKNDIAAKLVYDKFVDLITDYSFPFNVAPFGDSTTLAGGAYYGKVVYTAVNDTLKIQARADMKDFILNDDTPNPKEYRWKKGNVETVNSGLYGLKGAYSVLERHLVLIEAASQVAIKQAAYDAAKQAWADDRAYLINKTYETEAALALENLKTSEIITPPYEPTGRAEDLIFAIKDFRTSRTNHGENSSTADTVKLLQAIVNLMNAKKAYIGDPHTDFDHIEFLDIMSNPQKIYLGNLTIDGLRQKVTAAGSPPTSSSLYGGKNYETESNCPKRSVDPIFDPGNEHKYDAILKILWALFPGAPADTFNTWADAELWIDGAMSTADLEWMYDDNGVAATAEDPVYNAAADNLGLKSMSETKFLEVYNRFWGLTGTIDEVFVAANATWEAGCYSDTTFNQPYRIARFTGTDLNYNVGLAAILSLIDPNNSVVGTGTWDWDANDVNNESAIFRNPAEPTEFRTMLLAEEALILELAKTTYRATLDKIKAKIDEIEAAFDAKAAEVQAAYATDMANYNDNNTKWNQYQTDLATKKRELLNELTGSNTGTVVPTIPVPDANTHNVPSCMTKYLDHEGLNVYNGAYKLGGKQLAWANEFLPDYPAKLKEWMIATRTANHVIGHLNTLINVLDPAYRAATGIYQYEWEKYVLTVDPVTHEYEVDVDAIRRNYDAADAATLLEYFDNYNRFQRQYVRAWEKYLEDCTAELGFWKKVLAAYNAGYDPLEMAIKEQKNVVEQLEKEVEIAKKKLELAEAEYKETLAKLLN
jgi:Tfp pilus assembly protein PilE